MSNAKGLAANDTNHEREEVLDLNVPVVGAEVPGGTIGGVERMVVSCRRVVTTDDGRLQVVFEADGMDQSALENVKALFTLQQTCKLFMSLTPVQRDLFDA